MCNKIIKLKGPLLVFRTFNCIIKSSSAHGACAGVTGVTLKHTDIGHMMKCWASIDPESFKVINQESVDGNRKIK